jgi:hypothetical protein
MLPFINGQARYGELSIALVAMRALFAQSRCHGGQWLIVNPCMLLLCLVLVYSIAQPR